MRLSNHFVYNSFLYKNNQEQMKKYKIFSILIAFYSLFITNVQAQYPGCPNITIDQGDNITTSCTDPCVTLTATVLETGSTNQYTVSSIPYNPPFSYSGGTPVSVNTDDVWSSPISLPFNFCFFVYFIQIKPLLFQNFCSNSCLCK